MKINGLSLTTTQNGGMNILQGNDSVSKNIQNQISNAQKQLQELYANKEMSIEEKMKKRQEIQQQIADLNHQIRQHQIEQRKEQQAKKSSMDDMLGGIKKVSPKSGKQGTGLSQASMKAMISADSAMVQVKVQGGVATKMDGRAGVLEAEIKLDMARGDDVTKKKEELAEVERKAITAESAQMNTLAETNRELEEAAKAEQQTEKADDENISKTDSVSKDKKDKNITDTEENISEVTNYERDIEENNISLTESVEISILDTNKHVDVYL